MEHQTEIGLILQLSQIGKRTCLRDKALVEWTCWSQNKQSFAESALQYNTAAFELQKSQGNIISVISEL